MNKIMMLELDFELAITLANKAMDEIQKKGARITKEEKVRLERIVHEELKKARELDKRLDLLYAEKKVI